VDTTDRLTVMTCFISHTTVDCANAYQLSEWWKQVLGYVDVAGDPNLPGHEECMIVPAGTTSGTPGPRLLFIEVPEAKQVKNRLHLDLRPAGVTREDEIARLLALGAAQLDDRRLEDGRGWMVLADPEGNEFCVVGSQAEPVAQPTAQPTVGAAS
jgi:catechol 2,3-dioxygenase-like lactoylglutathione lyase family enzyme